MRGRAPVGRVARPVDALLGVANLLDALLAVARPIDALLTVGRLIDALLAVGLQLVAHRQCVCVVPRRARCGLAEGTYLASGAVTRDKVMIKIGVSSNVSV